MTQRNEAALRKVAEQILTVLPDQSAFDNNRELRTLLKARIDLHWGKKINKVLKVLTPVEARSQELLPEHFQSFEISQKGVDQLMPGDKNFNKTLLANHFMSKRVVQWQLNVSFWYAPNPKKNKLLIVFLLGWGKCSTNFSNILIGGFT